MKMPWEQDVEWNNTVSTNATESGFNQTVRKDQATLIAELISRVTSLEDDMEFALKHIRILEVDKQIEVISPSWEGDKDNIEEYTWEQNLRTLLTHIGVCDIGKERWFDQDDGLWYDRKEHDHITFREVIDRAMNFIDELGE